MKQNINLRINDLGMFENVPVEVEENTMQGKVLFDLFNRQHSLIFTIEDDILYTSIFEGDVDPLIVDLEAEDAANRMYRPEEFETFLL